MIPYGLCLILAFNTIMKDWRQNQPILLFFLYYSTKFVSKISKPLSYLGKKILPGLTDLGFTLNSCEFKYRILSQQINMNTKSRTAEWKIIMTGNRKGSFFVILRNMSGKPAFLPEHESQQSHTGRRCLLKKKDQALLWGLWPLFSPPGLGCSWLLLLCGVLLVTLFASLFDFSVFPLCSSVVLIKSQL